MTLKSKLISLALVTAVLLIIQGGFGMMKMGEMAERIQSDLQVIKSETGAMVAIENAQSRFKTQVQEWKNILIRGNDAQSFDKYLGQFDAEEKKVQSHLASAVALMKEVGLSPDDVTKLAQHHLALGESYRSALKEFDSADPDAGKLADTKVKGIDRATSDGMTKLVTTIEQHFSQRIATQMEQSQATYIASRNGFALIISLGLLMAVVCATVILRDILRQLGGEPAYAVEVSRRIAMGNLAVPVVTRSSDTTRLLASMSHMQSSLIDLVRQVHQISGSLSTSAQQVHAATQHVSAGSEQQNEAAGAMAAAVEQMTVSIGHVATNAQDARSMALEVGTASEEGGRVVKEVITDINAIAEAFKHSAHLVEELGKQTNRISDIALVIKEIADQTNLLALNAAIEAARAGEHGRGFAVVADEVRKLAERTTKSTSEIASMIVTIQNGTRRAVDGMSASTAQICEGIQMASRAGDSMGQIEITAQSVLSASAEISDALNEQSAASTLISKNVESISNMAEENSSSVKEVVLATEHLEALAREMIVSVDRFTLTPAG